jgi:NDP-sugar pyrophosphorylase family protein
MEATNFPWKDFIADFDEKLPDLNREWPWLLAARTASLVADLQSSLGSDYQIANGIAIHHTAQVETHVVLKGPLIIGPHCFVASHAYLRGGVWLAGHNSIGPGCEVKSAVLFAHSKLAHFNFVGDSIIGAHCNFEAGAVIANHYNERADKKMMVRWGDQVVATGVEKFGALVGDACKVGANAVLSPGTLLAPRSVVARLQLV